MAGREIVARLAALPDRSTVAVRRWRRGQSRRLAGLPGADMLRVAKTVLASRDPLRRFVAYELIRDHPAAVRALSPRSVCALAGRLATWGDADMFGCFVAGPAWRAGRVRDADVLSWTRSRDRWWRRAALVATVPLNVRAQGGAGDARRTVRICETLVADREPVVVKALSWALRALVPRDARAVRRFLARHADGVAPLVQREVASKLRTGRKS